jgi:aminopeptidase
VSASRLELLADVLVGYSAGVREGDVVLLEGPDVAAPLLVELYRGILRAGGHALPRVQVDGLDEATYEESSEEQLDWVNPIRFEEVERVDVRILVMGDWNTKSLTSVAPERQARRQRALRELGRRFLERAAAGELRWVLTAYPTAAAAQDARMSLREYEDFVYRASLLDDGDPVARWREFGGRLERVAERLGRASELRVVGPDTDLRMSVAGRTWIPSSGHENFPDGEVFTGPVETSVEGTIRFSYPAVFRGRAVDDVRLRFEEGVVVEAAAARGQELLDEMLDVDEGARRVGEFAFGLNDAIDVFTRNILFDEKLGGTVHLALGASYPETGGENESGLHWDMISDLRTGGEVYADGELVYRDGAFLPDAVS